MLQRFLDPSILAGISGLDLVAKTVVDGFVAGLHRSPDFGFSQEFAEYRAYTPGDDLRNVDWNVYARSEKLFLKRYRGTVLIVSHDRDLLNTAAEFMWAIRPVIQVVTNVPTTVAIASEAPATSSAMPNDSNCMKASIPVSIAVTPGPR